MTRAIIARANAIAITAAVVLMALFGVLSWVQSNQTQDARILARHTNEVIGAIRSLHVSVLEAETGQRGFLLTGDPAYLQPYERALDQVSFLQGQLQHLTADNPAQQEQMRALAPTLQRKMEELGQSIELRRAGDLDAALRLVKSDLGRRLMQQVEQVLSELENEEQALLAARVAAVNRSVAEIRWTGLAAAIAAALAMLWAARMLNQAWRRSYQVEQAQRGLALQLRASLDSLSQGVAVFSVAKRLRHWNACFQILLDFPPPCCGRTCRMRRSPNSRRRPAGAGRRRHRYH